MAVPKRTSGTWQDTWQDLSRWFRRLGRATTGGPEIPADLWLQSIGPFGFLTSLGDADNAKLKLLVREFLGHKEFHGTDGLVITDQMAIAVAAQACLPLLHLRAPPGKSDPSDGSVLAWYSDFVGIVVHPNEVVARRERVDNAGVVHHYDEVLAGEAMELGPVMLSWTDVADAGQSADRGYNVVIHEFAHKIDMADGVADGCPWLWSGFMGHRSAQGARRAWLSTWHEAYEGFCERVLIAERFGGVQPWLDPYGTQSLDEFFAVACEAYFVNRQRFSEECGSVLPLLDAFYRSTPSRSGQTR